MTNSIGFFASVDDIYPFLELRWPVAINDDGQWIVRTRSDTTVEVMECGKSEAVTIFREHTVRPIAVAITRNGERVASGGLDNIVKVWTRATGECLQTFHGHTSTVSDVAFNGDGSIMVTGSADSTVKVWDVSNGTCLRTLEGHKGCVRAVAINDDGSVIASGGDDKVLRLWHRETGMCFKHICEHKMTISSVDISGTGQHVVSGGEDHSVWLWDLLQDGGSRRRRNGLFGPTVSISRDGRVQASCTDRQLEVYDEYLTRCIHEFSFEEAGTFISLALSGDGKRVVIGGEDGKLLVWEIASRI